MGAMSGVLASYGGGSGPAPPPLPPTTGAVGIWALFSLNPVGYPGGDTATVENADTDTQTPNFLNDAPYPTGWVQLINGGPAPYLVNTWYDQLSANNLTATGSARPVLDSVNKLISFSGAQGMVGGSPLFVGGSSTGTIYFDIAPLSLAAGTRVILETGPSGAGDVNRLSIIQIANQLSCSIYNSTPVVALANTKIVTLANTDRIFCCFQFDTTQGTAANQTALYVNNSSAGVTSPISSNCGDLLIAGDVPNVGARNGAASNFFNGNMWSVEALNVVDDAAARLVQWNYRNYLLTQ